MTVTTSWHKRTRQGAHLPPSKLYKNGMIFGQMLRQIQKIRADLSEQMLNSGYFITILHKIRENIQLPPLRRKASALYAYASWLPRSND
jgi:hypothetical protein